MDDKLIKFLRNNSDLLSVNDFDTLMHKLNPGIYGGDVMGGHVIDLLMEAGWSAEKIISYQKEIQPYEFSYSNKLEKLTVGDNITKIGSDAFYFCRHLKQIYIPDSVTDIGNNVFYHCDKLEDIRLPQNITELKNGIFLKCFELRVIDIPESVQAIGSQAFFECKNLVEIYIPRKVVSDNLGEYLFEGCESLQTIYVHNHELAQDLDTHSSIYGVPNQTKIVFKD